jgi:hypothetical protein
MNARLPDPLVVTTRDAGSWWKRAQDAEGHGLYAKAGCTDVCPELRSIRELAVFGLTGMLDAVPVPAGSAPPRLSELERMRLRADRVERAYAFDTAALKRRIDGLEAERRETNEWVDDAAEALRVARDRISELEALKPAAIQTCRVCGAGYSYGQSCSTCMFRARMAAEAQAVQERPLAVWVVEACSPKPVPRDDDPNGLHHTYRLSRDLPETGGAR